MGNGTNPCVQVSILSGQSGKYYYVKQWRIRWLGCEVEHLVFDGDFLTSWVAIKCFFVDTPPEKVIIKRKRE
jgi:hypothetical protein